ncbi:hypothetical protein BSKO_10301 [Bryopsis sp. KO-2023]|nr:hypothetical protein BSKO_10301 [Bryopsis sp. KO-2023]
MEREAQRAKGDWGSLAKDVLDQVLTRLGNRGLVPPRLTCMHWKNCADSAVTSLRCNPIEVVPPERLVALFPSLTSLDLTCDWVSCSSLFEDVTSGIKSLRGLETLRHLSLNGWSALTDEDVVWIRKLESVRELDLTFCSKLTDVGMIYVSDMVQLRVLKLMGCSQLTNQGFEMLSRLSALEALSVSGTSIGDKALSKLVSLTNLKELGLMECSNVSDWGVRCVLTNLRNLVELDLTECSAVSDRGLAILVEMKSNMRKLKLEGCDKVTVEFLCSLEALTEIKVNTSSNPVESDESIISEEIELFTGTDKTFVDLCDTSSESASSECSYSNSGECVKRATPAHGKEAESGGGS